MEADTYASVLSQVVISSAELNRIKVATPYPIFSVKL